ncbi:TPA: hypothetical protein ACYLK9_003154 [Burkholderia cenocepacia]
MTTNTYGGYTVDQLREFIRHHYDAEHGGDNIDELTNDSSASVKIVRDLLDAIEPQQDGDLLRPIARWVYNAVRVNLNLLHGICNEFGCLQGEDVATWLRARLAGVPTPCMCSGVGPCEQRTNGSCRRDRTVQAAEPVARISAVGGINGIAWRHRDIANLAPGTMLYAGPRPAAQAPFQQRVQPWMLACFGAEISADKLERNHRFFEEAGELVQACGMMREDAHALVDYTWSRPVGETTQEVGGVMVTLAALCLANGFDMHTAGETELARVWTLIEQIRAKQATKPKHSPLPGRDTGA